MPMMIALVTIIGITYGVSVWRGGAFWDSFYPQFFATVFGVIVTVMLTYAVWLRQQKVVQSSRRQQLVKDLRFELRENLGRLKNLETLLDEAATKSEGTLRIQGLRTVTMKYALKPENLLYLADFALEDDIDWIAGHCEEFNHDFHRRFRQFLAQVAANPEQDGPQRARMAFRVEITPDVNFIRAILERLGKKLEAESEHTAE